MRRNAFGEFYVTTAEDVRSVLDQKDVDIATVHVSEVSAPEGDADSYTAEVLDNQSGELVLYLEHQTADAVEEMIDELKLERAA